MGCFFFLVVKMRRRSVHGCEKSFFKRIASSNCIFKRIASFQESRSRLPGFTYALRIIVDANLSALFYVGDGYDAHVITKIFHVVFESTLDAGSG